MVPNCPKHVDADYFKVEHDGELTPSWTAHCSECERELKSAKDGKPVNW